MAALSTQKGVPAGVALTYAACAGGGDSFQNTGKEYIHVKNVSGGTITVTVTAGAASANVCSFGIASASHDLTFTVANGADKLVGPFNKERFNSAADGTTVAVTYSGVTTLTIAVIG